MLNWRSVEIPKRMRTLEKDHRGYPIPFIVTRDQKGIPHFSGNDLDLQRTAIAKRLCNVCGKRLERTAWFVGGIVSITHRVFFDGPLHEECARYSLQVCPYLAAPNYSKPVELAKMKVDSNHLLLKHKDPNITNTRPAKFGLAQTSGYITYRDADGVGFRFKAEPWLHQEWWKDGCCTDIASPEDLQTLSQEASDTL